MQTSDYLAQLRNDKEALVNNLVKKGVSATSDETFTALVPKVLDIRSGKYAPRHVSFYKYSGTELNEELENLDTSKVTSMNDMFNGCSKLISLDLSNFNTSNVTNMNNMFGNCNNLTSLDLSSFDTSKVTNINNTFSICNDLTNLTFCNNLGKGYTQKSSNYSNYTLTLSSSNLLTHDSLMDVINKLYNLNLTYDIANGGTLYTQKLILDSTNITKLTAEEIAIATDKGWTVL